MNWIEKIELKVLCELNRKQLMPKVLYDLNTKQMMLKVYINWMQNKRC